MGRVRLFVYGSLKRGGRHHDELAGAVFLGLATTLPGYRLEPLGEYLALVSVPPQPEPELTTTAQAAQAAQAAPSQPKAQAQAQAQAQPQAQPAPSQPQAQAQPEPEPEHETAVPGELFEVDESKLSVLDAFEGNAYERGNVRLASFQGVRLENPGFALAYFRKAR
jgi:gamma-glutamylcyclotransferase (GGCT)/AIG2-like uncharacterized protein YtfP